MANRFLSNIKINDAYTFPASDGSNGQVIVTDGAGNLSFASPSSSSSASVIYRDNFTGDGSTTVFYLQNTLSDEDQTNIYIDGVYQEKGTYSLSNNAITFTTPPPNGDSVEVMSIAGINVGPTTIYQDNFTGDGTTTDFTLEQSVSDEVKTMVYFNGVYQFKGTYSLNGTLMSFDTAPANGVAIEVISIASAAASDYNQKMLFYGKASEVISKGDAIMLAGQEGDHFLLAKATQAAIGTNHEYFLGLASQDLAQGEFGYVTEFGKIIEIDTSGYTAGDILWFDAGGSTAGALTTTEPAPPLVKIQVAAVIRSHANEGVLFIRPNWYHELNELHDVNVTSVADKDILVWDNANGYWENSKTLSGITFTEDILVNTYITVGHGGGNDYYSTAVGADALYDNTSGDYNTAIGTQAISAGNGSGNTAVGYNSLYGADGQNNTAVGQLSMVSLSTGDYNTGIGDSALFGNQTGNYNVAIGRYSGYSQGGSGNVHIGALQGSYNSRTTTNSVTIGYDAAPSANNVTNEIVIGTGAVGNGSNTVVIGNNSITSTELKGNVGIGVVPSAWGSGDDAIELGGGNQSVVSGNVAMVTASGAYFNGSNWVYRQTGVKPTLQAQSYTGEHIFYGATNGTAGNTISFSERMRIDSDGNVGIGVVPTQKFDIANANNIAGIRVENSNASYSSTGILINNTASTNGELLRLRSSGSNKMVVTGAGNVGVGTTSPGEKLEVNGTIAAIASSDPTIKVQGSDVNYQGRMRWSTTGNYLEFLTRHGGTYYTNNLVLDRGNVGIGTTSPNTKLDVRGVGMIKNGMSTAGSLLGNQLLINTTNTVDNTGWQGIGFFTSTTAGYGWSFGANRSSSGRGSMKFYYHNNSDSGINTFTVLEGGGVTFNGDTAQANALDDYEEGTWTPGLNLSFTGGTGYTSQSGKYVKIGSLVYISFNISWDSTGLSGSNTGITGKPFNSSGGTSVSMGSLTMRTGLNAGSSREDAEGIFIYNNSGFIYPYSKATGAAYNSTSYYSNSGRISGFMIYSTH